MIVVKTFFKKNSSKIPKTLLYCIEIPFIDLSNIKGNFSAAYFLNFEQQKNLNHSEKPFHTE